ncbi:MAG TPA: hypothetical protein VJM31_09090 [Vicinamibacterales bacterium]|nr:hypothetical protein [Vicinamibacterales bacterium]
MRSLVGAAALCGALAAGAATERSFDLEMAMGAAGREVPTNVDSYAFFYLKLEAIEDQDIRDLASQLEPAAKRHDYIGIAGPDAIRNRTILRQALQASGKQDLKGVTFIYLGPKAHEASVRHLVEQTGAGLRYVVFPGSEY